MGTTKPTLPTTCHPKTLCLSSRETCPTLTSSRSLPRWKRGLSRRRWTTRSGERSAWSEFKSSPSSSPLASRRDRRASTSSCSRRGRKKPTKDWQLPRPRRTLLNLKVKMEKRQGSHWSLRERSPSKTRTWLGTSLAGTPVLSISICRIGTLAPSRRT